MPWPTPLELDSVGQTAAKAHLIRRFPRLRGESGFLDRCLAWQESTDPRPNFYFRWHLARLVRTCHLLADVAPRSGAPAILDLASYAPYSLLTEEFLREKFVDGVWTRSSLGGEVNRFLCAKVPVEVQTVACELGTSTPLPFPPESFDVVILAEVIEHLGGHPQLTLLEIHRVLRTGGVLVLTTPNSSSWKKIRMAIDGVPAYDSPTFGDSWGHRYEFSYYHMRRMLVESGYGLDREFACDVYFDDPTGPASWVELCSVLAGKLATGQLRRAAKLWQRRGSGLFFAARRTGPTPSIPADRLISI